MAAPFDPRVKPPFGSVEIDRDHPLARGLDAAFLLNEAAGYTAHDITQRYHGTLIGAVKPTWVPSADLVALRFVGAAGDASVTTSYLLGKVWTVICRFTLESVSGTKVLIEANDAAGNYSAYYIQNSDLNYWGSDGSNGLTFGITGLSIGVPYELALVRRGDGISSTGHAGYLNGRLSGEASSGTLGIISTLDFGSEVSLGDLLQGSISGLRLYSRALSDGEILQGYVAPYAYLRPIIRRRYFVAAVPAAQTYTPTATIAGQAGVAASSIAFVANPGVTVPATAGVAASVHAILATYGVVTGQTGVQASVALIAKPGATVAAEAGAAGSVAFHASPGTTVLATAGVVGSIRAILATYGVVTGQTIVAAAVTFLARPTAAVGAQAGVSATVSFQSGSAEVTGDLAGVSGVAAAVRATMVPPALVAAQSGVSGTDAFEPGVGGGPVTYVAAGLIACHATVLSTSSGPEVSVPAGGGGGGAFRVRTLSLPTRRLRRRRLLAVLEGNILVARATVEATVRFIRAPRIRAWRGRVVARPRYYPVATIDVVDGLLEAEDALLLEDALL